MEDILKEIYEETLPKYAIWEIEDYSEAMNKIRKIIEDYVEHSEK